MGGSPARAFLLSAFDIREPLMLLLTFALSFKEAASYDIPAT